MPSLWRPRASPTFIRRFEERLDDAEQDDVQRIIDLLCIEPDGRRRNEVHRHIGRRRVVAYDDGTYWVSYKITGNGEFELLSCHRHGRAPRWGRRLR